MTHDFFANLILGAWTALFQGLLFGAGLALLTRIVLVLFPPATAATRFVVWFATLIVIAVVPPAFMLRTAFPEPPPPSLTSPLAKRIAAPIPAEAPPAISVAQVAPESPQRTTPEPVAPVRDQTVQSAWVSAVPLEEEVAVGFLALYGFLVALMFGRLGISYWRLRRLKRNAYEAPPELGALFLNWLRLCNTHRPVRLLLSRSVRSPMAVGFSQPAVILPESLLFQLKANELDHVGLHELAHLRRLDDWSNLLQRAIQAVYFFNPVVHWIARKIDFEREVACDDWVLTSTGEAKPYARSLAKVFEYSPFRRGPLLASGAVFRKRQIFRRIEMLLDGSRDSRPRISHVTLVVVLMCLFGAFSQIIQSPALIAFTEGVSSHRSKWSSDGRTIETEIRGNVEFNEDDTSIQSISPGGYFRLQESVGYTRRKIEARSGSTAPEIVYSVNGSQRPLDEQGRAWLAATLPSLIRETGIGAEERAQRILLQHGALGVFKEIDRISSDSSRRRYLSAVIGSGRLSSEELQRAMDRVRKISSDHEKANLLIEVMGAYDSDQLHMAYFDAVNTIQSDHDRRRVLSERIKDSTSSPDLLALAAKSAEKMQSDHDKSAVLQLYAPHVRGAHQEVRRAWARAAASISSDHDKAAVLSTLIEGGDLEPDVLADLLHVTGKIQSNHDKARVLQLVVRQLEDPAVQEAFFAAAGTLESDHDRSQVLKAVMEHAKSNEILVNHIAASAERVSSDHEKANILEVLARTKATPALFAAARTINSDSDKRRVLQAVLTHDQSPDTARNVVELATTISSDHEKVQILGKLAEQHRTDPAINDAIRKAADKISSDSDYRRIVSKLISDTTSDTRK